jgi:hypothetical protein
MYRKMSPIEVSSDKGTVYLHQEVYGLNTEAIALDPEQVDIVIKWLQEAKEDALAYEAEHST